ncbi:hypothetical protein LshimejAT787_2600310 [Lyophyllum shimeji]|uniref:Uncharacterized protein n=1 Tax=Lyophyllum shimeji TaxID=47721 RepID=A0A9P3UUJ9_LYOSH|nr:hypothetical protein LshimejAT787_2600310 [Lyophyllum shimeji]
MEERERKGLQKITRTVEASDWAKYDYYAGRIRSLAIGDTRMKLAADEDTSLDPSVLGSLSAHRPVHPPLPNLRGFSPRSNSPPSGMRAVSFSPHRARGRRDRVPAVSLTLLYLLVPDDARRSLPPLSAVARLFKLFRHDRCTSSLAKLVLRTEPLPAACEDTGTAPPAEGGNVSMIFTPLFSLRALRFLYIQLPYASKLDNDWFAGAATSWPHREPLRINSTGTPNVTLAGLVPLISFAKNTSSLLPSAMFSFTCPFAFSQLVSFGTDPTGFQTHRLRERGACFMSRFPLLLQDSFTTASSGFVSASECTRLTTNWVFTAVPRRSMPPPPASERVHSLQRTTFLDSPSTNV